MTKTRRKPEVQVDFDTNLKDIIKKLFREALELMHPELAAQVDWKRPPEFMEQAMRRLIKAYLGGAKYCDILAKLWLLTGEEKWLLLHWEIEVDPKINFGKRMLEYRMLLFLQHKIEDIAALVLFAGEKNPNQVNFYEYSFAKTKLRYEFPVFVAWNQDEQALQASENPFVIAILAIQYVLKTKGNLDDRLLLKEKLYELAAAKNMDNQKLAHLLIFVEYFVSLPSRLEDIFVKRLHEKIQMEEAMPDIAKSPQVRRLADAMFHGAYGAFPQDVLRRVKKAESQAKKAENQTKKAENQAKVMARQMHKAIYHMYLVGLSVLEIAKAFNLPEDQVQAIIAQEGASQAAG
ncbi:MAG: hypothetical protein AAB316_12570 [Bacteroidota bacterium]